MLDPNIEDPKYIKAYSDERFWAKVAKVAKKAGEKVIYMALLLFYVMKSDQVSLRDKLMLAGALGYLILPVDLIPDFIPIAGYTDDFAALVAAYKIVKGSITPAIRAQAAAKCQDWFGDFNQSRVDAQINQEPDDQ